MTECMVLFFVWRNWVSIFISLCQYLCHNSDQTKWCQQSHHLYESAQLYPDITDITDIVIMYLQTLCSHISVGKDYEEWGNLDFDKLL